MKTSSFHLFFWSPPPFLFFFFVMGTLCILVSVLVWALPSLVEWGSP